MSPSGMGQTLPAIPITCKVKLKYLSSCLNSVVAVYFPAFSNTSDRFVKISLNFLFNMLLLHF